MKKIALLLYGISYCEKYRHSSCPNNNIEIKIDYRESLQNYKDYIYEYFKDYQIDVFIVSNPSILSKKLIEDYSPKDYLFIDDNDKNHSARRQKEWLENERNNLTEKPKLDNSIHIPSDEIGNINTFQYFKTIDDINFKGKEIWGPSSRLQRNIKPIKCMEICLDYSRENNINYENIILTRFDMIFKKDFNSCPIDLNKINIISQMEDSYSLCDNFYIIPFKNLKSLLEIYKRNINNSLHKIRKDLQKINGLNFICNENTGSSYSSFYKINRIKIN